MEQDSPLPYRQLTECPETFTATTVAARMVDGLGFRYYWATEGLREEDLNYKPNETARTSMETIEHIYGLSNMILNAAKNVTNGSSSEKKLSFDEMRSKTLLILKEASDLLKKADPKEMENMNIIFQRGDSKTEFPFWNLINGPIEDAVWHVGQVVSFRRSSGNPFNGKVSVLTGKVRE
ncbi:hypothetical protein R9C00_05645 [Flammeovirgaceae bacterium SG7u.111]|nr:hypothetical protein [Flammeovirgaceae bacterium SG7u.132]WPO36924.1 hypothetical protein R9C00_05645 [Flammeovirgaceae bacterium SG7u.111]